MTHAEVNQYRRRLLALKRRQGARLTELEEEALRPIGGEASGGISDVPVHPSDLGNENYEEEVAIDLLEHKDRLLTDINDALARIEQGTFGKCENCGGTIPKQRLQALPYARYCIQCAQQLERQTRS